MHHCCVFYHVDPDTSDKTAEQTTERKTGGQGAGTYIYIYIYSAMKKCKSFVVVFPFLDQIKWGYFAYPPY